MFWNVFNQKKTKTLTSVVGVTANLNMYMTFKNGITDTELDELKNTY